MNKLLSAPLTKITKTQTTKIFKIFFITNMIKLSSNRSDHNIDQWNIW